MIISDVKINFITPHNGCDTILRFAFNLKSTSNLFYYITKRNFDGFLTHFLTLVMPGFKQDLEKTQIFQCRINVKIFFNKVHYLLITFSSYFSIKYNKITAQVECVFLQLTLYLAHLFRHLSSLQIDS